MNSDAKVVIAVKELNEILAEREHYKATADTLQATLEETEEALRAAKGQLNILRQDRRYEVGVA